MTGQLIGSGSEDVTPYPLKHCNEFKDKLVTLFTFFILTFGVMDVIMEAVNVPGI